MKEKEFNELVEEKDGFFNPLFDVSVYWGLDDEGNVVLDEDSMKKEFHQRVYELRKLSIRGYL